MVERAGLHHEEITLNYKTPEGISSRLLRNVHPTWPVIRRDGDNFITIQLMNIPVAALKQSYLRTKARNYAEYKKTMELHANSRITRSLWMAMATSRTGTGTSFLIAIRASITRNRRRQQIPRRIGRD